MLLISAFPLDLHGQDGFLFGPPRMELTVRAGSMLHHAGGDLFEFFLTELTLDRKDFRAPAMSAEVAIYAHPRVDVVAGVGFSSLERRSEFRAWEDEETGLPIEQTTTLRVVPMTASARIYPLPRGRRISSLAWIPARTTPFVGVGGGISWYSLRQVGDFVSEPEPGSAIIFSDDYGDRGTAGTLHALAGLQHWLSPRFGLNLEGRYTIASATPAEDFTNWDELDLGGLQVGFGLSYRW